MVRGMRTNELTRVTRAGAFSFPTYRRYSTLKVTTGFQSSTEFLAFDVTLAEANSAANASAARCPIDATPKCQVKLVAPNKVKIEQRVLVNLGGDQYEEQMADAIEISGAARSNLNSNIDIFRAGLSGLNCQWESGRSECTIERNFDSASSEMKYQVKIQGTPAAGLTNLNFAAAMAAQENLGQAAMDMSEGATAAADRGPTLCTITDIPSSMNCTIDSTGNLLLYRTDTGEGEVGRKRFATPELACSELQAKVASGECFISGNTDPCAGRTSANGPRSPNPSAGSIPGASSSETGRPAATRR